MASDIQASKKAPPGSQVARPGASVSSPASSTSAVLRRGARCAVRASAATRANECPWALSVRSLPMSPSEYSSDGKSARAVSTSCEDHQVTPQRFSQSSAYAKDLSRNAGASSAETCGAGAPISCSQMGRLGSLDQPRPNSMRYSARRRLCSLMPPYSLEVPLKIHEWMVVEWPRRAASAGVKLCSPPNQHMSYSEWWCSSPGAPASQAASIVEIQVSACATVSSLRLGCNGDANWLNSLPMLMPRKLGRPANVEAMDLRYSNCPSITNSEVNRFCWCQVCAHAGM